MHIDHRNPRVRRGFAFVALAAVLGLAAVGLTQCRLVNDNVTGVDLRSGNGQLSAKSACKKQCEEKKKACKKAEEERHKLAKKACGTHLPTSSACKKAEDELHKANKKACDDQAKACKNNCYNEGAGSAGA